MSPKMQLANTAASESRIEMVSTPEGTPTPAGTPNGAEYDQV